MNAQTNSTTLLDEIGREIWTADRTLDSVALPVAALDIVDSQREGDGLVLTLADGRIVVVQDFYEVDAIDGAVLLAEDGFGNQVALQVSEAGKISSLVEDGGDAARDESESMERVSLARLEEMFGLHFREFDALEEAAWESRIFRQTEDAVGGEVAGGQSGGGFLGMSGGGLLLIGGVVLAAALASGGSDSGGGGGGSPSPNPGNGGAPSAAKSLQEILADPRSSSVDAAKFSAAGITGVTSANLNAVKLVIDAWDDSSTPARADMTRAQVQSLVEIATDAWVTAGGTVVDATLETITFGTGLNAERIIGDLVLDINTDADSTVEQEVEVTLGLLVDLEPAVLWRFIDADGDGTIGDRIELDNDYDGTYEFVIVDADEDDKTESIAEDPNDDGTVEYTLLDDGTGTAASDDGTDDSLEFANGVAYNLAFDVSNADEFHGITRVNLGSGAGLRSLQVDDAALALMADSDLDGNPDSGFSLTIDGVDGTVVFVDDEIQSTTDPSAPQGYDVWRGTDGTVLVADALNVFVATSVTAQGTTQDEMLSAVLRNPSAATAEMFAQSGINDVTLASLDSVKTVLGAFSTSTTPARASLTRAQVQELVSHARYFEEHEAIPASVESARWTGSVLTLGYSFEDDDGDVTLWHDRTLNAADFSIQSLTARWDDDADGTYEAVWVGADGDEFAEIGTIDTDGDGTVDYMVRDGTGTNDEDGTHDTLEFANGVTYHLDLGIEHVLQDFEFAGITRINMGSGSGERTLQIDDDVLSYMSDADFDGFVDSGYSLTIDGATGDSVLIGDDRIQLITDSNTPAGYVALRGTLVTVYVDSDITLLEPASSLQVDPDTSALDISA